MELPAVVPQPRRLQRRPGGFPTAGARWQVAPEALRHPAVAHKLKTLGLKCRRQASLPAHTLVAGEPEALSVTPPDAVQGYVLAVSPQGIVLRGHDADGLFWGLVTLEQLLDGGAYLPCLVIEDWPAVAMRGHHDDISRKQVSRVEDFQRIIRLLSRYKVNVYTPYIEDMLHLASYPDIGEGRGKLMPDEVRAVVREGRLHNVAVLPTFSLIGHQENLLRLPRYAHLGRAVFQGPSSYDPENPAVREFLARVIGEVAALFPCEYFHMGFDETQGVSADAYFAHANWCAAELRKHGKRAVMWADMIYNHFGHASARRLDPSIILVNWQYDDVSAGVPHWDELTSLGREVWGLAGYNNWACFLPDFEQSKRHFADWMRQLAKTPAPALFSSMWGDEGYENSRDLAWNLFACFAENAWSGSDADPASFERRFQRTFYGATLPKLEALVRTLPGALSLGPGEWWTLHRRTLPALRRTVAAKETLARTIDRDEKLLRGALADVASCRRMARKEVGHLDHFEVGLRRMLSVAHRIQFARGLNRGMPVAAARSAPHMVT